jgi:threonine dehydrogenase-like Zn-dependent dehydrogenase
VAKEFGATHIVAERGEEGLAQVLELTDGIGADAVLECVGTEEARAQAVAYARPGGMIGLVGVPHGDLPTDQIFWSNKGVRGGPAPVRAYLPHLLELVLSRQIDPGKVFDLTLPLAEVAEAYQAMDERRAIKVLLQP